ncbi:hypothetical protein ASG75_11015 [Rhodanobacter sp. Soil772]|uniref:hypothetical protein n=1 Tax=Rhodanobacter sp. Soil772 TaxID=1736406 RepID=UPI0006F40044|nr:hypothetical protein [Rhodanobacter sp. Soil772]KRE86052.1 hypothetical protein ASG75_11015 [Rhodanobacter sp. Soil772]
MRFIPTSTAKVESLRKQAKRLQRNGGGKHADLLNRVARTAGYEHWHHVTLCFRETEGISADRSLIGTVEKIVQAELAGKPLIISTGSETSTSQPFMLFASGIGDAWMLDPFGQRALCLVWRGQRQSPIVRETPDRLEIQWEGSYELRGEFFSVDVDHPLIGQRTIGGYPVEQLRSLTLSVQPVERTIDQVIRQDDAVELSLEIIRQLIKAGWSTDQLTAAARQGARYSPSRDSVVFPAMVAPE